jgi:hypothetical protein
MTAALSQKLDKIRPGWQVGTAHAVLTYYVKDMNDMMKLINDPEYHAKGRESEEGWIDASKGEIHIGYEKVYLENGELVD